MQYIIMCGGKYDRWQQTPKQLSIVNGEPVVARTIRLLHENGVTDIAISSNDPRFDDFGVPVLHHENNYHDASDGHYGLWCECFYPMDEPCCYLFGDVVFSPEAIKTIVNTDTRDVEFFASAPPFGENYIKSWAEPFAFKVQDQKHFKESLIKVEELKDHFKRDPIAWECWQVIKGTLINKIDYTNYTVINDYTCDIDGARDIKKFNDMFDNL